MNDLWVPHELPWFPVVQQFPVGEAAAPFVLTQAEVLAIKALKAGNANGYQQQIALEAIIKKIGGTHDMTFRPGKSGDRASAFAEGRRFAGLMLVKAVNLPFKSSGDTPDAGTTKQPADPHHATRKHPKPVSKRSKPGTKDPGAESV